MRSGVSARGLCRVENAIHRKRKRLISPKEYRALVAAAARLYVAAGRHPYYFARGKLGHDPVFPELLSRGIVREDARILDLGCGQGVLGALFLSARELYQSGVWPVSWPAPPKSIRLYGIELQDRVAGWGRSALNGRATLVTGDLRSVALPDADLVVILDVLHYLDPDEQSRVLERIAYSLRGGGTLLLRVGDASAGWRTAFTRVADKLSTLVRGQGWPPHYCRPVGEWTGLLGRYGFSVVAEPMSAGTPFANVLLVAQRR